MHDRLAEMSELGPSLRPFAVEHAWAARLNHAALKVHELEPAGFAVIDVVAGHWVSDRAARVTDVVRVEDCFAALAAHDVELRLTPTLWPYVDAVVVAGGEFSAIRMRKAGPRGAPDRRGSRDALW